ncbi:MAG TPA: hypothetical protein VKE94_24580 [Gemmataceae bacterium]|nr:hypothetical protein [Gemmataceae bacterium]
MQQRNCGLLGKRIPAAETRGAPMMDVNGASHQELDARAALDECEDRDLAEMNVRYAVVKIGGKTRVVSLEDNPVFSWLQSTRVLHDPGLLRLPCQVQEARDRA